MIGRSSTTPLQHILDQLEGVRRTGTAWTGRCPAHDDRHASLSVSEGQDGRALIYCYCFAGCTDQAIVRALGLELRDLFPVRGGDEHGHRNGPGKPAAEWAIRDADGQVVAVHQRFDQGRKEKHFVWRRPGLKEPGLHGLPTKHLPLYGAEDLRSWPDGGTVVVVEGEKARDALNALGVRAVATVTGASGTPGDAALEPLTRFDVVVWPDADDPGHAHMARIAARLRSLGARVRWLDWDHAPDHGDAADFRERGGTPEQLTALLVGADAWRPGNFGVSGHSGGASDDWDEPVSLLDVNCPTFPTAVLPGWLRAFVEAEAVATQTPPDLAAMLSLAALATALAKRVAVEVWGGWREPVNVWIVTTLASGKRKSAVYRDVTAPLGAWERERAEVLRAEIARKQTEAKVLEHRLARAQRAAAEGAGAEGDERAAEAARLADQLAAFEVPTVPRLAVDDCSPERLATLLHDHCGRLAVLSPEGDVFDLMAGKYNANAVPSLGVYLCGHTGDDLRVDRVGRAPVFVAGPALTLGLTVQPVVLQGLVSKPGFRGRGLLARILYSLPPSLLGQRQVTPPPVPDAVRNAYAQNLTRLLGLAPAMDPTGKATPHVLRLSPGAAQCLRDFMQDLEPKLAEQGELGHIADWASKLAGAVVRVAGLLHGAEHAEEATPWAHPISEVTLRGAVRPANDYLIPHALAAFGAMGASPVVDDARYLLGWIEAHAADTFTRREVQQRPRRASSR